MDKTRLEQALPVLLQKACARGLRALVKTRDVAARDKMDDWLWRYAPDSFLPHAAEGTKLDPAAQPVWLTVADENANQAQILFLTDGATTPDMTAYDMCCVMLDGRVEAHVAAGRAMWADAKQAGHTVSYFQESERGWDKKA